MRRLEDRGRGRRPGCPRPALAALLLVLGAGAGAFAQGAPPPPAAAGDEPAEAEVDDAVTRYFQNRLRSELQLTDDQVAEILPRVEAMEQARSEARRRRARLVRDLRLGLDGGAADAELAAMLEELERVDLGQRDLERTLLASVDAGLTVRQRVQLRFFVEEFRRDLQRRVRSVRGEKIRDGARGGGPPVRRPGAGSRR